MPSPPSLALTSRIRMVPVAHGLIAYSEEVRRAIAEAAPACIAIEYPAPLAAALQRLVFHLPEIRLLAWRVEGRPALMIPGDPCDPFITAIREAVNHGIDLEFIDTLDAAPNEPWLEMPDEMAVSRLGLEAWTREVCGRLPARPAGERERLLARRLRRIAEEHESVLYIGSLPVYTALERLLAEPGKDDGDEPEATGHPPFEMHLLPVPEHQLGLVMREIPHLAHLYNTFLSADEAGKRFSVLRALQTILTKAADTYREEYDERVNLTEWKALHQFARNLSLVRGRLRPRLHELLTAAKGCVDDDFGAICLEVATSYPPNAEEKQIDFSGEEEDEDPYPRRASSHKSLNLHGVFGEETERLHHAYPHPDLEEVSFRFRRRRPSRLEKLSWRMGFAGDLFSGSGICSWPPEDEFIETFFRNIRQRAFRQIGEEHTTTEEFTSSLLDGLDFRETMRRWHEKKIMVRRERTPPGRIGHVVITWRDLPLDLPNVWQTCLYAENQNESDIAIYAQPLGKEMVGPGITRTEYFGILSVYPAIGIPDVWAIGELRRWGTCARLLGAAAVILSEERYVVWVAGQPPDLELREFARSHGRAFIHLPLASFSRTQLKRARQCHILSGRHVRDWADDYIPPL